MAEDYNQKSTLQANMIKGSLSILSRCIPDMQKQNPARFQDIKTPFTIVDLGCSTGKNSVAPSKLIIEAVREINPEMPIVIYFQDLPGNHFSETMTTLSAALKEYQDVYLYYVGKSFFESLFLDNTIDLMFSFNALHWVDEAPSSSDTSGFFLTEESLQTERGQKWLETANRCWRSFIKFRARELRPSGKLFINAIGISNDVVEKDEPYITFLKDVYTGLRKCLQSHKLEELYPKLAVPVVVRREKDFTEVFNGDDKTNLKLSYYETAKDPVLTNEPDERLKIIMSAIKAVTSPFFRGAMQKLVTDKKIVDEVLADLYEPFILEQCKESGKHPSAVPSRAIMIIDKPLN